MYVCDVVGGRRIVIIGRRIVVINYHWILMLCSFVVALALLAGKALATKFTHTRMLGGGHV